MSDQPTDPQREGEPASGASAHQPPEGGYPHPGASGHQGGYPQQQGDSPQPGGYPPQGAQPQPAGYPQQSGYPQAGYPQQGAFPQQGGQPTATGGSLTDLGFTQRITPALARTVYLAVIALAALVAVEGVVHAVRLFIAAGDAYGSSTGSFVWEGLLALVKGPLTGFLLLALGRFGLEYFVDRAAATRAA